MVRLIISDSDEYQSIRHRLARELNGEGIFPIQPEYLGSEPGCKKDRYRVVAKVYELTSSPPPAVFCQPYGDYRAHRH